MRRSICLATFLAFLTAGCASSGSMRHGRAAEQAQDYDRAVVEYTKVARANPTNRDARAALERVKLRAAQEHTARGRRLAGLERYDEAVVEYQLASELNPTDPIVDAALRDARQKLRTKIAVTRGGRTELESLIERTRNLPAPGLDLPQGVKLPGSLVFGNGATAKAVFTTVARFANLSLIFDAGFRDQPLSIDLRDQTLENAMDALTASTRTFYRVTAPRTVTIVPDTAAKRREYEEAVVRTFYLSNADVKETIDLLRVVIDIRQISPTTGANAISIKDTPERIAAAAKLISAIDKARPEVVIDVELLEVDRTRLRDYGLQIASPGSAGISGSADVNRDDFRLANLKNLTAADVFLSGIPGVYYRLLKNDTATRTLANPQLRTTEGLSATARFGERVPVPVTTFAPIAAGGINTQPITSYAYENIGVNIDITPRTHHDDDVTLALKVSLSSISGTGFAGLPTFGNREITTTIRLKDGETNMLAGLIRDEERAVLSGVPGLSDIPLVGRLFANNHRETQQTDIILTLTPHIVRVLDLTEADLRPFRLGRDTGAASLAEILGGAPGTPREPEVDQPTATQPPPSMPLAPPRVAQPPFPQPLQGTLPGTPLPVQTPPAPKKPGGGGGRSSVIGHRSSVIGQRSAVSGHRSSVIGHR
ncbi:MAG TPA: secretin N-terminal domain-containing protein [Vicinamibacterales bacterium]|nr:secretin N-terminal domain-containing protein [Vicinamibacterales bacterium]